MVTLVSYAKLWVPYLLKGLADFDKITGVHSVPEFDELLRFPRLWSHSHGQSKVRYFSESLCLEKEFS